MSKKYRAIRGWAEDEEAIEKSIQPPYELTSKDGRVFQIVSWTPTVTIEDVVRVKIDVIVLLPETGR